MKGATAAGHVERTFLRFPEALRRVRAKRAMTQQEVGDVFGVSYVEVSRWETGDRQPRLATMIDVLKWIDDEQV